MLPLAHAGHWIVWALYALPVIVVVASIVVSTRRERREQRSEAAGDRTAGEGSGEQPEGGRPRG